MAQGLHLLFLIAAFLHLTEIFDFIFFDVIGTLMWARSPPFFPFRRIGEASRPGPVDAHRNYPPCVRLHARPRVVLRPAAEFLATNLDHIQTHTVSLTPAISGTSQAASASTSTSLGVKPHHAAPDLVAVHPPKRKRLPQPVPVQLDIATVFSTADSVAREEASALLDNSFGLQVTNSASGGPR